jgi:hypothetical protein
VCGVGMEATGHARWFERLLAELDFELMQKGQRKLTRPLSGANGEVCEKECKEKEKSCGKKEKRTGQSQYC